MDTVELLKHRISLINDTRLGLECFLQGDGNATVANQLAIMQALVELLERVPKPPILSENPTFKQCLDATFPTAHGPRSQPPPSKD